MPCSLAIHNGATLLLMAPWAMSSFVGSAARTADRKKINRALSINET
jgi:hypothetical protein